MATSALWLAATCWTVQAGKEGDSFINLSGLAVGHYKLTFTGKWDAQSFTAPKNTEFAFRKGSVSLDDVHFVNHISAVPEPETYAMLLAGLGLGLVGTIVRRRDITKA